MAAYCGFFLSPTHQRLGAILHVFVLHRLDTVISSAYACRPGLGESPPPTDNQNTDPNLCPVVIRPSTGPYREPRLECGRVFPAFDSWVNTRALDRNS